MVGRAESVRGTEVFFFFFFWQRVMGVFFAFHLLTRELTLAPSMQKNKLVRCRALVSFFFFFFFLSGNRTRDCTRAFNGCRSTLFSSDKNTHCSTNLRLFSSKSMPKDAQMFPKPSAPSRASARSLGIAGSLCAAIFSRAFHKYSHNSASSHAFSSKPLPNNPLQCHYHGPCIPIATSKQVSKVFLSRHFLDKTRVPKCPQLTRYATVFIQTTCKHHESMP